VIWVSAASAASAVTPDTTLMLLALLLGLALLDALRGIPLTSPFGPVHGRPAHRGAATRAVGPRPSRFLLSTFRC
jgi:hypothetical protein